MQKTNIPGLVRDERTGAVLNTDQGQLQAIRQRRADSKKRSDLERRVAQLEERLARLEEMAFKGTWVTY